MHPVGQELFDNDELNVDEAAEEEKAPIDYTKLSTTLFVETALAVRYNVRCRHQHSQLLNLCELTGGNWLILWLKDIQ